MKRLAAPRFTFNRANRECFSDSGSGSFPGSVACEEEGNGGEERKGGEVKEEGEKCGGGKGEKKKLMRAKGEKIVLWRNEEK